MTPEELTELAALQEGERLDKLSDYGRTRLEQLRRELAMAPEVADDPTTLRDESRRPLLDGTDWNDLNKRKACEEVERALLKGAQAIGRGAVQVIVDRVLYGR